MSKADSRWPHPLRALSSRNYRLYFGGQGVSMAGNWMTTTTSLWLAYRLSGNPFVVGLVGFANQIPVLLFASFAGVGIDRADSLRVVRLTQVAAMLQSALLAAFALSGHMTIGVLLSLCLVQGCINAVDFPARQALVFRLAGELAHLDNVIALNSITFNLARLSGPALAGFVIAAFGPGVCYALDAASYLAVLGALLAVRLAPPVARSAPKRPLADLREGVRYAWAHPAISRVLSMVSVIALAGFAHAILAPVFARDIFHGDARTLGFLMSATGVGSLAAGTYLIWRPSPAGLGRITAWGGAIGGAGLAGLAISGGMPLALVCFAAAGMGTAFVMVSSNTLVQSLVDDDKRGRVLSIFTMVQGLFPVGSITVGKAAELFGPQAAVAACGAICLAAAAVFARGIPGAKREAGAPEAPLEPVSG